MVIVTGPEEGGKEVLNVGEGEEDVSHEGRRAHEGRGRV
jgi:hypothetical protein